MDMMLRSMRRRWLHLQLVVDMWIMVLIDLWKDKGKQEVTTHIDLTGAMQTCERHRRMTLAGIDDAISSL
jgi:hypothetical protein